VIVQQSAVAGTAPVEVRTTAGTLQGSREGGVAVFRGIPYARPPVGALRLLAPHPVPAWAGVRPAHSFGPIPPQPGMPGGTGGTASGSGAGDDWLTLNIWSPDPGPGAALPVMVWIPGGGYVTGAGSFPESDGANLATGGVVLVTINYRLGIEGFAQIDGAPANRGLLDQVAALQWVRDNISAFGGDADRVTIFGESAGGGSAAALLAMPRAAGLFRRAIAQSVPGVFFSPALAGDIAAACATELGRQPTIADLSTIAPADLPAAGQAVADSISRWADGWGPIALRPIPFAPVVDGDVLPASPWDAPAGGAAGVDLLTGHTRHEHRLFSLIDGVLGAVTPEQADTALDVLAPGRDGDRRYRDAFPDACAETLYEFVHGDWLFRMPTLHLARAHAAGGRRTHLYELTWSAPGLGGILGACHGLDVPLVFGNLSSGGPAVLIGDPPTSEAARLSASMRQAWIAFAADGNPGWPTYDEEQRLTQVFDVPSSVTPYPEEASRLLWQDHHFGALPLL
jgi:para-nitrobenzyl esterase